MSYSLNERFFDVIDTEQKAYFLGLMYADGCVQAIGKSWKTRLGLHKKDHCVVAALRDAVEYTGPLYLTKTRTTLQIANKLLGDGLIRHGCVPKKSLVLKYPTSVPVELQWHFIRGYFDGDGCLSISGRGARWTLVGTESLLTSIATILNRVNIHATVFRHTKKAKVFILSVSGNSQIARLLEHLYENAQMFMPRKFQKKVDFDNLRSTIRPIRKRERITNHQEIVDDYLSGMKVVDMEAKHRITNRTMYKILNRNNVKKRQVSYSSN